MRASPFADPSLVEVLHALLWGACLLCHGFALWRVVESCRKPTVPWSVCFAIGCAAAIPLLAVASTLGISGAVSWLMIATAPASLFIGVHRAGTPLLSNSPPARPSSITAWVLITGALIVMAPVVIRLQLSYDVLSYHLPLTTHLRESFGYMAGNYYSRLPAGAFLLYAGAGVGNQNQGIEAAGLKVMLLFSVLAGASLCCRLAGQAGCRRQWRGFAGVLYAWHPMVWNCVLNSNSDLLTSMFALAAVERALSGARTHRKSSLMLAGFLASSAAGIKFSALGIVVIPVVAGVVAATIRERKKTRAVVVAAVFVAIGAIAGYAPWLLRSWIVGGHPFHPFAGQTEGWSSEQNEFLVSQHLPRSLLAREYWSAAFSQLQVFGYNLTLSPSDEMTGRGGAHLSVLLLFVASSLTRFRHSGTRLLLVSIVGGYCAWLTVGQAPARFVLPAVAMAIALTVTTISKAPMKGLRIAACGLLVLAFAFTSARQWSNGTFILPWVREAWQRTGAMPESVHKAAWENHEGTRLLLLFEARSRWFPDDSIYNTVWDLPPWADDLKASRDSSDFATRLREAGYTHVFVNEFEWGRLINFYGELERPVPFGDVGANEYLPDIIDWLSAYPPCRFAGFTRENLQVLAEFLVLTRETPSDAAPAGRVAEIRLASIPN